LYHGKESPYPHSVDIYDCFEDPGFAREVAFKPFKLIDLTVLTDEAISRHGLAAMMEMLFKHYRAKNFLTVLREILKISGIKEIIKQYNLDYFSEIISYIMTVGEEEEDAQAGRHLIEELVGTFPQERETIMTFAEQFRQEGLKEGMTFAEQFRQEGLKEGMTFAEQFRQEGRTEGRREAAMLLASNLRAAGKDPEEIQRLVGLLEGDLMDERS